MKKYLPNNNHLGKTSKIVALGFLMTVYSFATKAQTCPNLVVNGSFEDPAQSGSTVVLIAAVPGWSTTATDGLIEIWAGGFNGVPASAGTQFAELNATQISTLIQTFSATAGQQLTLGFDHRGRDGVDVMGVEVGPVGGPYTSLGTFTDGNTAWGSYKVGYTIPSTGNYQMRFTAVSSAGGSPGAGNFIDNVFANVVGTPVIDAKYNSVYCDRFPSIFVVKNSTYSNLQWTITGGTVIAGQGTDSVKVQWTGTGSKTIKVDVTSANGCTSSSQITVAVPDCPLPAVLRSFAAQHVENHNMISWQTSEMTNFDRFELEKSTDAKSFEKIYEVKTASQSTTQELFSFKDDTPTEGANYYRLKMVDLDKTSSYSRIISAIFVKDGEYALVENPVKNRQISIQTNIQSPSFSLIDLQGKVLDFSSRVNDKRYILQLPTNMPTTVILKVNGLTRTFTIKLLVE